MEDPQPDPGPDPVQKPAPAQTFTGELDQITDNQRLGVGDLTPDLPPLPNEELPMPGQ